MINKNFIFQIIFRMVWKGDDIYVTQPDLLEMCQITYIVEAGWLPDENNAKN